MISLKSRSHRSSSTLVSSLIHNKENAFDLGNRIQRRPLKPVKKESTADSVNLQKKPSVVETKPQPEDLKSVHMAKLKISLEVRQPKKAQPSEIKEIESQAVSEVYSNSIMETLLETEKTKRLTNVLGEHQISRELRAKMVDWMIEVISSYKYSEAAFFTSVRVMDSFFQRCKVLHKSSDLHLVGVAAIFIACKYEEIYPLKVKLMHEKIAHRKLSREDIIRKEGEIMTVLDFDLVGVNNYELLQHALYVHGVRGLLEPRHFAYLEKIALYLSKMVMFDMDLMAAYDYSTLAAACIYVAFKIIEQVDPTFSSDQHVQYCFMQIKSIMATLKQEEAVVMEAAAKVLALAKSFDKEHPTLTNLRKFNGFTQTGEGCQTERANQ